MSFRCQGITKSNKQCKKKIKMAGYCNFHKPQAKLPYQSDKEIDVFVPTDIVGEIARHCVNKGYYKELAALAGVCKNWHTEMKQFMELNIADFKFTAGIQKYKSFAEVYETNKNYLSHILGAQVCSPELLLFKNFANVKLKQNTISKKISLYEYFPCLISNIWKNKAVELRLKYFASKMSIIKQSVHSSYSQIDIHNYRVNIYKYSEAYHYKFRNLLADYINLIVDHCLASLQGKRLTNLVNINRHLNHITGFNTHYTPITFLADDIQILCDAIETCRQNTDTKQILTELFIASLSKIVNRGIFWPLKAETSSCSLYDSSNLASLQEIQTRLPVLEEFQFGKIASFIKTLATPNSSFNTELFISLNNSSFHVDIINDTELILIMKTDYNSRYFKLLFLFVLMDLKAQHNREFNIKVYLPIEGEIITFSTTKINLVEWRQLIADCFK